MTIYGEGSTYNYTSDSPLKDNKIIKTVTIYDGVTQISDNLFKGCSKLETITILSSIYNIGSNSFDGCTSLTTITYSGFNGQITCEDTTFKSASNSLVVNVPSTYNATMFCNKSVTKPSTE